MLGCGALGAWGAGQLERNSGIGSWRLQLLRLVWCVAPPAVCYMASVWDGGSRGMVLLQVML